jgi:hypothetical protein
VYPTRLGLVMPARVTLTEVLAAMEALWQGQAKAMGVTHGISAYLPFCYEEMGFRGSALGSSGDKRLCA